MVSLTLDNGAAFKVLKENVLKFYASPTGSGSVVFYNSEGVGNPVQVQVDESASSIQSGASSWFLALTVSGKTIYLNPTKVISVTANGSGSIVVFGTDQFSSETFSASESVSSVASAIDTSTTPSASLPYTSYVGYVSEAAGNTSVIEIENTTGFTFTWTSSGNVFTLTPNSAFSDLNKIFVNCGGAVNGSGSTRTLRYDYSTSSTSALKLDAGAATVLKSPFEIRIYP